MANDLEEDDAEVLVTNLRGLSVSAVKLNSAWDSDLDLNSEAEIRG